MAAFRTRCFPGFGGDADEIGKDYVEVVRFFGPNRVNPSEVRTHYDDNPFILTDPLIDAYAREMADTLRAEGRLYDGPPVMKLVAGCLSGPEPGIYVQPADYDLQAGTCFALDWPHSSFELYGGTLRDYYRHNCKAPTVENNPLAICLGVCGSLLIEEGDSTYLLRVTRSKHLVSLEGTLGPSVAGAVDYSTDCDNLNDLNNRALGAEVEEELNLRRGEYTIVPLAWAIELFRGERPQLFSLIRTTLNRDQIRGRLESIPEDHREFEDFDFVSLSSDGRSSLQLFESLNFEGRANVALALEWWRS